MTSDEVRAMLREALPHEAADASEGVFAIRNPRCNRCGDLWPCITRRLADALRDARKDVERLMEREKQLIRAGNDFLNHATGPYLDSLRRLNETVGMAEKNRS